MANLFWKKIYCPYLQIFHIIKEEATILYYNIEFKSIAYCMLI